MLNIGTHSYQHHESLNLKYLAMKNALIGLILIAYPFIIYFGLNFIAPTILAIFLALLFTFRHLSQAKNSNTKKAKIPHLNILLINVMGLLLYTSLTNSEFALKLYPVVVNLSFLFIFAYSIYKPPSVVEIIATMKDTLDDNAIKYTKKVTLVWCVFFLFNGTIATWTIYHANPQYWLIYNGIISYVLMGLLMTAEIVYRRVKINPADSV